MICMYTVSPKRPSFYFWITRQKLTNFNDFWHVKSWENFTWTHYIFVRCSHFTLGNPKKSFSTISFIYFRLFTLPQKKTNSNCSTAALAVHLLLFSASYYLHSPITVPEARYRRSAARVLIWTSWGLQQRLVAMWAEFQHTVLFYATDQCQ